MKNLIFLISILVIMSSCHKKDDIIPGNETEFKQKMREFVIEISQYSKALHPNFIIVPQNGIELVTTNGLSSGQPHFEYLNAIDANGQEDLWYGYNADNESTPSNQTNYVKEFLDVSKIAGNQILVTDYCWTNTFLNDSYLKNANSGYISFVAIERELNIIPAVPNPIHHENNLNITDISQVKNFLYLINPNNFESKSDFITAVNATNYDLLIMDYFFSDQSAFTTSEINQLRNKENGGKRLVIAYMSIGEAEDYRYYWQPSWNITKPSWLDAENPDWAGNFKVKYWDKEWQKIIYGNDNSYLKKIIDSNFDGVYLDIIDAFEYYED